MSLSHNFREQVEGCTTHGETFNDGRNSRAQSSIFTQLLLLIELFRVWMRNSARVFAWDFQFFSEMLVGRWGALHWYLRICG